jgi:SAM-dependent methyltransferase
VERGEVADVIAQGERVNNVKDAENVPILQADDYCALFKRQLFDEGIAFNEKMQGFSMLAQDFFLQILQKKYLCKLEKNCFVFTAKLKNYDFGKYDMYAFEKKWGESYNELIGFNQRILKAIEKSGAKKILHIGCLLGSIFFELAERDGAMKFYGISQNAVYMNIAANVAEKVYDDFAKFDLLLSEGEFDYIILESIPESCPDVKDLLKALRRSLKNSGEMIAVIPNAQFAGYIKKLVLDELPKSNLKEYDTWAERYFTKKQFSCLASEAGFSIMDIYGVAGQEEVDFIKSLQNVEHNETADIFFRLCRLIYVLYPERREIAFSLRKLEYDLDCEKSASFLAGDIKNGALSFRQLLFYLERYTVHKERCLYNLLAEWNKNAEYDLISRFGDAFLAYDALPNDLLVKTLERIVR